MIPETSINWKAFEYKFSDNPQRAFENLNHNSQDQCWDLVNSYWD